MRHFRHGRIPAVSSIAFALLIAASATPTAAATSPDASQGAPLGVLAVIPLNTDLASHSTYDGSNGNLYIPSDSGSGSNGTLSVISTSNNSLFASVSLGVEPGVPVVDSWDGDVYIPNFMSSFVTVVSGVANQVVGTIQTQGGSAGMAFDPENGDLYVPSGGQTGLAPAVLEVISGATDVVVTSVTIGWYPTTAIYDGADGNLYVLDRSTCVGQASPNEVTVVSTRNDSGFANVSIGDAGLTGSPAMLDPSNGVLYVALAGGVSVVSTISNQVEATFSTPGEEPGFVDWQGNVYLYQPGFPANFTVLLGSSNTVSSSFTIGNSFWGLTYDPSRGVVFTGGFSLNVTSVSAHRQIESIPTSGLAGYWFPPTYVPGTGDLYGVVQGPDTSVVVIDNVPLGASGSSSTNLFLLVGVALLGAAGGALAMFVVMRRRR